MEKRLFELNKEISSTHRNDINAAIIEQEEASFKQVNAELKVFEHNGRCIIETWNCDADDVCVKEEFGWISSEEFLIDYDEMLTWIVRGPRIQSIFDDTDFCDSDVQKDVLRVKQEVFEKYNANDLTKARTRANPFETIRNVFFMNRAALKMANIDASTGFMFTNIDRDPRHRSFKDPYYFADICAGPGGFSEYILWRKQWAFKGFGFTLKGEHDFKLNDSTSCSDVTFRPFYGSKNDGNICDPENIRDFAAKIHHETESGVHFVMADGGFSVEGNENLQEVLSKQLYLCQCLTGLQIIRCHGHFVTKLFDIFTSFSVGLIFLMYHCFEKIAILKPNTSRPANSERYLVCSGLKNSPVVLEVKKYLFFIANELWFSKGANSNNDILEIVPLNVMKRFHSFMEYVHNRNTRIAKNQMRNLRKLEIFCNNPSLTDLRQDEIRNECLNHWRIPNKPRAPSEKFNVDDLLNLAISKPEFLYVQPRIITSNKDLTKIISDISDWHYVPIYSSRNVSTCNFYAGVGASKVFRLQNYKWVRVKNFHLVKGTLLYGEMVFEKGMEKKSLNNIETKSLHVIDALRLGDTSLADLPYEERVTLIDTYCKSVNFETSTNQIRIRSKPSRKLSNIVRDNLIQHNIGEEKYFTQLPRLGYKAEKEYFLVNSIILLKTDETQSFNTTYVLRVQLFIDNFENEEDADRIKFEYFLNYVSEKLQ